MSDEPSLPFRLFSDSRQRQENWVALSERAVHLPEWEGSVGRTDYGYVGDGLYVARDGEEAENALFDFGDIIEGEAIEAILMPIGEPDEDEFTGSWMLCLDYTGPGGSPGPGQCYTFHSVGNHIVEAVRHSRRYLKWYRDHAIPTLSRREIEDVMFGPERADLHRLGVAGRALMEATCTEDMDAALTMGFDYLIDGVAILQRISDSSPETAIGYRHKADQLRAAIAVIERTQDWIVALRDLRPESAALIPAAAELVELLADFVDPVQPTEGSLPTESNEDDKP